MISIVFPDCGVTLLYFIAIDQNILACFILVALDHFRTIYHAVAGRAVKRLLQSYIALFINLVQVSPLRSGGSK